MSKFTKRSRSSRIARGAGIVAAAAAIAAVAAPQTIADPNLKPHFDHLITCIGLMITDPDAHAANCLPNRVPEVIYKEDNDGIPIAAVVPPPAPPPPVPTTSTPTSTSSCGGPF